MLKTKLKDDMSYPFVIDMYLNLFKKFKRFKSPTLNVDLAGMALRKGLFSINI